jgi:hypothetical protein
MGFSNNFGFLPSTICAMPLSSVVEAPNLTGANGAPQQSKLPLASHQSHITGPAPAKFNKSPAKPYDVISDPLPNDILLGIEGSLFNFDPQMFVFER